MSAAVPVSKPVVRLDSIGRPGSRPVQPSATSRRAAARHVPKCCDAPDIAEDDDGSKICQKCFTLISEQNITADVTFAETAAGGAVVQGGYVSESARFARTLGSAAYRRVGGEQRGGMEQTQENGKRVLQKLCPRLQIFGKVQDQALALWGLAAKHNFTAGRRTEEVVASCLYASCRRQPDNAILLIDISELLKVNVFRLGEVYKDLCKTLYLADESVGTQHIVDVEPLILRYCQKLEFGSMTKQVAEDAVRIIRRMKRDWIATGRHPAGLCGACIILAARMNNFRRTVREVVFIAKISDFTVGKRLEEFKRTRSSTLTVDQFRTVGHRLKFSHDPPAVYQAKQKEQKKEEKKRKRQQSEIDSPIEISDEGSNASSPADLNTAQTPQPGQVASNGTQRKRRRTSIVQPTPPSTQLEPRRDADGFAIPAIPIDPALTGTPTPHEDQPKRRRGRPKKSETPVLQLTAEDLAAEEELEREIEGALNDPKTTESQSEVQRAKLEERTKVMAEDQKRLTAEANKNRRNEAGITWWNDKQPADGGNIEDELAAEFEDDPEVINCLLSEQERITKEKIWVAFNEQWLREEQMKELQRELKNAETKKPRGGKGGKGGKKKKGKMGDGSLLGDAETPVETPAEATIKMIQKRATTGFSKHLNYKYLAGIYGHKSSSGSRGSSEAPGSGSVAGSPTREGTPATTVDGDADGGSPPPARRSHSALLSPQATQQPATLFSRPTTPAVARNSRPQAAPTALMQAPVAEPEQEPAAAGAEQDDDDDDEDLEDDEDVFRMRSGYESPREDIGEDDYEGAIDPLVGRASYANFGEGEVYGDDDEYE